MAFLDNIKQEIRLFNHTNKLILINVIVFIVANILVNVGIPELPSYIGFIASLKTLAYHFYGVITYMFTHIGLGHVFFNMLMLFFSGRLLEDLLGKRILLFTYFGGGIIGALFFMLISWLIYGLNYDIPLIGASASVLAILVACAVYMPEMQVMLFGVIPIRLKWLALLVFLLSSVVDLSSNTGGKLAHIGGALFGLIYAYNLKSGNDWSRLFERKAKIKTKLKVVHRNTDSFNAKSVQSSGNKSIDDQETLDGLLDKIKKSGYDSLSKSEKDLLNNLSRKI
jgi:membrane associated rhomboid family serine protease